MDDGAFVGSGVGLDDGAIDIEGDIEKDGAYEGNGDDVGTIVEVGALEGVHIESDKSS